MFMLAEKSMTIMMSMPLTVRSVCLKLVCGRASATTRVARPTYFSERSHRTGLPW